MCGSAWGSGLLAARRLRRPGQRAVLGATTVAAEMTRAWRLIGADGAPYESAEPGTLGGHRRSKIYGRLDCRAAERWIARGHYVRHRVFFRDEATAIAAGYRPCAGCLPERYAEWKADPAQFRARHG